MSQRSGRTVNLTTTMTITMDNDDQHPRISQFSIQPSPNARMLYSMMVARADDGMRLSLAHSIELSCTLARRQCSDITIGAAMVELQEQQWIEPDMVGGGWLLT